MSDEEVYSVDGSTLIYDTILTPYDYSLTMGIRKIKRFGYEDISKFKDGTESAYGDAATVGLSPFEYLFEVDYKRQEGIEYFDQQHFVRYVRDKWLTKVEYIKDGFADIEYYEATQRFRLRGKKKLSFNFGGVTRLAEPYGYDPLEEWTMQSGNLHYTQLAIEEGYSVDVFESEYRDPTGSIVATSSEVWNKVIIPDVLKNYVERKRGELGGLFSYHNFNDGEQWYDYSGGLILGTKISKSLGLFIEGKYNKYWNKEWYDFKCGINYVIF